MTKFDKLANERTREELARIFGASVPTIQRWFSDSKTPKYVDIIIEQKEDIANLKKTIQKLINEKSEIIELIESFKIAQNNLFNY